MKTDLSKYFEPIEIAVPAILDAVRTGNLEKARLITRSVSIFLSFLETIDADLLDSDTGTRLKIRTLMQLQEIEQSLHKFQSVPLQRETSN